MEQPNSQKPQNRIYRASRDGYAFVLDRPNVEILKAMPDFEKLVAQSKTSGTTHAAVFSLEPPSGNTFPAVTKEGEHDTVLNVKVGDLPIGIIVAGRAE